jgi:glycosyltransferase involved in cell wall biosynthesis
MPADIPVSVIIVTKNEERHIARCLAALDRFDEVIVVNSPSTDKTEEIAESFNVKVIDFEWNGQYPKKRQWCLDNIPLKNNWVFFVDADEVVTPKLAEEIKKLDFLCAGYFVRGHYMVGGKPMRHAVVNNKLCLINRRLIEFPVVQDLDIPGMGEIEGHYQPVLKGLGKIGQLKNAVHHYALDNEIDWYRKHIRYAAWEKQMIAQNAYPIDPIPARQALKVAFRSLPYRGLVSFVYYYIARLGFLDGRAGLRLCALKMKYYRAA